MIPRLIPRIPMRSLTRAFSAATVKKPTGFKEKSFKEAWLMDSGAYPVMSVIVFAVAFAAGACGYFLMHPDSRISKSSRTSIFRGELKGAH